MQDANAGKGSRGPQVPPEIFGSVYELNHRFLDLLAGERPDWAGARRVGLSAEIFARIVPLSADQRGAAAHCPYALFDLRFTDDAYWNLQLHGPGCPEVADAPRADDDTLHFVGLALFFAWHVASSGKLASRLLLGMSDVTYAAFRGATIGSLASRATGVASALTARWSSQGGYWNALTDAAARPSPAALRRIQLYGLQLAAAARLA